MFPDALRLIRFERCLVLFVATRHESDRLILALEGEWFDLGVGHLAQLGAMIVQRNLQGVRSMSFFR
jgi:hypothetical protein